MMQNVQYYIMPFVIESFDYQNGFHMYSNPSLSKEECVETLFQSLNPNTGSDYWIEEKDGKLWYHYDTPKYTQYDTLFNLETKPDAPATFSNLKELLLRGTVLTLGWSDRGTCLVCVHEIPDTECGLIGDIYLPLSRDDKKRLFGYSEEDIDRQTAEEEARTEARDALILEQATCPAWI